VIKIPKDSISFTPWWEPVITGWGKMKKLGASRPLRGPECRWEDKITTDLKDTVWESMDSMNLTQNKDKWWDFQNTVMNLRVQ
jgi:hypothetical protein